MALGLLYAMIDTSTFGKGAIDQSRQIAYAASISVIESII
jgi:hypothetical protein